MTTAKELERVLLEQEKARLRLRVAAVKAVLKAAAAVTGAEDDRAKRKAKLRESAESAIDAERAACAARIKKLREKLTLELVDVDTAPGAVSGPEVTAGRAVLEAMSGERLAELDATFREQELARRTNLRLGTLRRWVEAAREAHRRETGAAASPVAETTEAATGHTTGASEVPRDATGIPDSAGSETDALAMPESSAILAGDRHERLTPVFGERQD